MIGLILAIVLSLLAFVFITASVIVIDHFFYKPKKQTRTNLNRQIYWMYKLGLRESSNILWKSKKF